MNAQQARDISTNESAVKSEQYKMIQSWIEIEAKKGKSHLKLPSHYGISQDVLKVLRDTDRFSVTYPGDGTLITW